MIHQPDFTKQSTDRLEMIASTKDGMAQIDIILLNECDATLDLKGTPKDSFLDLRNEVRERLQEGGYDVRFIDLNF